MVQLLLLLAGLIPNSSDFTANSNGNTTIQTQQAAAKDTGGEDGHPIPPRIIGG